MEQGCICQIWVDGVVDPLAEKYLAWSPYNYVDNNPLKFIDPDGKRIKFAKGTTKEFKNNFKEAYRYLKDNGAGGLIGSLKWSFKTTHIQETTGNTYYSISKKTIFWNPTMGVKTNEGNVISPAAALNHEADHANQNNKNPDQLKIDKATEDPNYDNAEEKRVIECSEQDTALKLGEIEEGEVTRKDHGGTVVETTGPTSTTIVETSQKEEEQEK